MGCALPSSSSSLTRLTRRDWRLWHVVWKMWRSHSCVNVWTMTPQIEDLKAAFENALAVYMRAISARKRALEEFMEHGVNEVAREYATATQIEAQRREEYLQLANALHMALARRPQQR
jgi:hypothetical protein